MELFQSGKTSKRIRIVIMGLIKNFVDFGKSTSIHGIRYTIASSANIFERIFWIAIFVLSLTFSIYLTTLFWGRYSQNSTRTILESKNAPATTVPFPAVTICNSNMILESKLKKFLEKLDYVSEQELLVTKNVIWNIFAKQNLSELAIATKVLEKNGYEEIKNIFKRVSQSCDELIVKCSWDQWPIECNKIFEETFTVEGRCCSFNYLKQPKYTIYYGASTGLKVQLVPDFNKRNSAGVVVSVHNPQDFPGGDDNMRKLLPLGRMNYLQVKGLQRKCGKEVKSLSFIHRQCLHSDERELEHFGAYSYANCFCLCQAYTAIERCGCVPYYYNFLYEKKSCSLADISCLKNISNDSINNCDCPAQCEDEYYTFVLASTKFSKKSTIWMLNNTYNYNENSIVLNIFFATNWQTIWVRDVITSITYLIASFGGIYCLFLGCSIISLVEILYFFIIQNLKSNNEIQAQRRPSIIFTLNNVAISRKIKEPVLPYIN